MLTSFAITNTPHITPIQINFEARFIKVEVPKGQNDLSM